MQSVYRAWGIHENVLQNEINPFCTLWQGNSTLCAAPPVQPAPTSPKHYLVPGSIVMPNGPPYVPDYYHQEILKYEKAFCPCECEKVLDFLSPQTGPFNCYRPKNMTCVKKEIKYDNPQNQFFIASS